MKTDCKHTEVVEYVCDEDHLHTEERVCVNCYAYELVRQGGCFEILNDPDIVRQVDFQTFIKFFNMFKPDP